jgi:hypothetical protein
MNPVAQYILAAVLALMGIALVVVGLCRNDKELWVAGLGVFTTVAAWLKLPRPKDQKIDCYLEEDEGQGIYVDVPEGESPGLN